MAGSKHLSVDTKTAKVTDPVLNLIDVLLTLGGFTIDSSAGVKTINLGPISGVKVGAIGDKIGFLGATPVIQPTGNVLSALALLGLIASPSLTIANITALQAALDLKAGLDSPVLAGTPTAPTPVNATSSTQVATTAFVHALLTDLLNAPPATLDTLKELADAIGDDPNFAVTVGNLVATKLAKASNLSDLTDAVAARSNLGLGNVNNTSDANKPVSLAQAAADTIVANAAAAALSSAVAGINTALDLKAGLAVNNTFTGQNIFTLLQTFNAIAASSIVLSQLANPGAPTVTPIGSDEGATWSYKIVAKLSDGTPSAAGPAGTTIHGDQTLDATNKNSLAWTAVTGAASYDVYRTAVGISPATTGKIANVATNAYIDTGAAGDSATPPINNTTGRVLAALHDKGGALYNARAYGVLGDGVTDDSPAIAALVALVPQGAHIFFPAATYRLASAITISKALTISGAGTDFGGTQFVCDSTASAFIVASNTNSVVFRNFRLQSYARALAITGPVGITAIAADLAHSIGYLKISDVIVNGFDTGVDFRYCQMGSINNLTVEANKLGLYQKRSVNMAYYGLAASLNTSWGAFVDGDAGFVQQSSGTRLISPIIVGNGASAAGNLKLLYQDQTLIVGAMIDVPASGHVVNVRVEGCTGGTLSASYVGSAFTGPGVILQASDGFGLINDKIIGNQYGIRLISSSRCKINSCEFKAQPGYDVWINDEAGTGSTGNIVNGNSLGSAATTDPSIFEQNTNHTIVRDNVISGTIVVSNPELARGNYNYVTFLSADPVIWIAPALASSWVNYGAGETGAGYYLDADGWVHLQGTIKDGTTTGNAILFVLPAGYRPTGNRRFVVANNAAAGFIAVNTAGEVRINSGTNTMLSLEGIRFRNN